MAIFSTRSGKRDAEQAPTKNVPLDSIETLRTRARQRLIGAVVLVVLGIITFTLLFDSQPRPIPVDIQITMPDKDKPDATVTTVVPAAVVAPTTPAAPIAPAPVVETPATSAAPASVQASASLSAKEEIVASKTEKKPEVKPEVKTEPKTEVKTEIKPSVKPEPKAEIKSEAKPVVKPEVKPSSKAANDEAAKALAILEGKEPPKTASSAVTAGDAAAGRFVVQVGAFAENEKAREVRLKVERAGLKTYVHVAETPQGKRIRVRVGPFTTRAEADKAAAKIKTLDLPAAILTL
jgi:DedD protein